MDEVKKAYEAFRDALRNIPPSRARSIAETNAEQAYLWAKRADDLDNGLG